MQQIQQGRTTTGAVQAAQLDTTTAANAGAKGIQTTTALAMPLLQRLEGFSGKLLEQGTQKMVVAAKKQAYVDVQDGTFAEYGLGGSNSVYDMAYDGAAETAYVSKTTTDIKANASSIAAQNKYNPAGFMTAWESQKREISTGSKEVSPYVDAVTADVAKQYGDAAYAKIASNLATIQYETMKKDNSVALAMYEDEFLNAKRAGNEDAATTALMNRNQTQLSMLKTFQVSQRGIKVANKVFEKRVISSQVKDRFDEATVKSQGVSFALGFKKSIKDNPEFDKFSTAELDAMVAGMYKSIKEKNAFDANVVSAEEAKKKAINDDVTNTFNEAAIANTLTQDEVDAALEADTIDESQYKYYSEQVNNKGAHFTDSTTELNLVSNFAAYTVDDIMGIKDMKDEDKMAYITKLRTYKNSSEGKWTSTVQGRSALKLIENQFNVTQASIIAKITKPKDLKNYNETYQNFILEMEDLAPEQRELKAMHFAQAAIDAQEVNKIETNKKLSDDVRARNIKAIQDRAKNYQKKVGKIKSEKYIQGLAEFMQNYGVTGDVKFIKKDWELEYAN